MGEVGRLAEGFLFRRIADAARVEQHDITVVLGIDDPIAASP